MTIKRIEKAVGKSKKTKRNLDKKGKKVLDENRFKFKQKGTESGLGLKTTNEQTCFRETNHNVKCP